MDPVQNECYQSLWKRIRRIEITNFIVFKLYICIGFKERKKFTILEQEEERKKRGSRSGQVFFRALQ